jgi:NAD(P)H-hydrate epimerase
MKPLVSSQEGARIEEAAVQRYALEARLLMENAAMALAETLPPEAGRQARLLILCGRGHNGGDGLALAARLARGGRGNLAAIVLDGHFTAEAAFRLEQAERAGVRILPWPDRYSQAEDEFNRADILLDAVCGTGLKAALRAPEASLIEPWSRAKGLKMALDLPSGMREGMGKDDLVFSADETLCVGFLKACLYAPAFRERAGCIRLIGADIFPDALLKGTGSAFLIGREDLRLPPFKPTDHKGSRGRVAVFAGSPDMPGAAYLSANAAARAGTGYVRLIADEAVTRALASRAGGILFETLPDAEAPARLVTERCRDYDAVLAGPGWGAQGRGALMSAIAVSNASLVLDADALRILASAGLRFHGRRTILTPHPGEAAALAHSDISAVLEDARSWSARLAANFGATVILKAHVTWIADQDGRTACLDGRLPALATAGSGDVLAGIAAGLLARGLEPFEAAMAAVIVHHAAGEAAWAERGPFMAEDLLPHVSLAVAEGMEMSHARS